MKTIAIVTAFPPSAGSLNEYGLHLVNAFAARADIEKIIVIADKYEGGAQELDLGRARRKVRSITCKQRALVIVKSLQLWGF